MQSAKHGHASTPPSERAARADLNNYRSHVCCTEGSISLTGKYAPVPCSQVKLIHLHLQLIVQQHVWVVDQHIGTTIGDGQATSHVRRRQRSRWKSWLPGMVHNVKGPQSFSWTHRSFTIAALAKYTQALSEHQMGPTQLCDQGVQAAARNVGCLGFYFKLYTARISKLDMLCRYCHEHMQTAKRH